MTDDAGEMIDVARIVAYSRSEMRTGDLITPELYIDARLTGARYDDRSNHCI